MLLLSSAVDRGVSVYLRPGSNIASVGDGVSLRQEAEEFVIER